VADERSRLYLIATLQLVVEVVRLCAYLAQVSHRRLVSSCDFVRRLLAKRFDWCLIEQIYCGHGALVCQLLRQAGSNSDCATSDDNRRASTLDKTVLLLCVRSSWFNLNTLVKEELV
jgi:hypothetical protein